MELSCKNADIQKKQSVEKPFCELGKNKSTLKGKMQSKI